MFVWVLFSLGIWPWTESEQFDRFDAGLIERDVVFHVTSFIRRRIKNRPELLALEKKVKINYLMYLF